MAVVVVWEKKPLSELGIRPQTRRTIIIALAASIVMAVGGTVVSLLLIRLLALPAPPLITERITIYLVWFSLWLVFSSSIAEGVLYRGFVIERLGQLSGSIWIGAAITLV